MIWTCAKCDVTMKHGDLKEKHGGNMGISLDFGRDIIQMNCVMTSRFCSGMMVWIPLAALFKFANTTIIYNLSENTVVDGSITDERQQTW